MAPTDAIHIYLYTFSPYGRKITEYLSLRRIPWFQIEQAPVPPREDLHAIGVSYRRIPVVAIGKDVYCDSALILQKLEQLYPDSKEHPALGAKSGQTKALESLLDKWTGGVVFLKSLWCIPSDFPVFQNEAFTKDRGELWGGDWGKERQERLRGQGLGYLADFWQVLEDLVSDGRKFLDGDKVGLADVHGESSLWVFHWLLELVPGSTPEDFGQRFPKAMAWRQRYWDAVNDGRSALGDPKVIEGDEATKKLQSAGFAEPDAQFDSNDPEAQSSSLKKGAQVKVYPSDVGYQDKYKEVGELVGLTVEEVVIQKKTQDGSTDVRIHAPRYDYKVEPVAEVQTKQMATSVDGA